MITDSFRRGRPGTRGHQSPPRSGIEVCLECWHVTGKIGPDRGKPVAALESHRQRRGSGRRRRPTHGARDSSCRPLQTEEAVVVVVPTEKLVATISAEYDSAVLAH